MKYTVLMLFAILMMLSSGFAAEPANQKAPDFTLEDMQGNKVSLSDFKGKIVMINFWATWCPPCIEEMPSMEKLYKKLGKEDFVILAINIEPDAREYVAEFLAKNPYTYPVLLDGESLVQELYGAYRLPETVIVNRQGEIVNRVVGGRDWMDETMIQLLASMVNG
ncbi:MAG TPA: TlpA disulfide reductase family protein [Geopsychrobacteraceae bacterium]|nr:TlpA disulfide reductase family protein [Geopsychrobacteraceae bacterium]